MMAGCINPLDTASKTDVIGLSIVVIIYTGVFDQLISLQE
jgi:hypothetical protein